MTTTDFFGGLKPIRFEGAKSDNPFAYRHYDADAVVLGPQSRAWCGCTPAVDQRPKSCASFAAARLSSTAVPVTTICATPAARARATTSARSGWKLECVRLAPMSTSCIGRV